MKTTEIVNPDFKALRERAGLTLEILAGRINYSVAAVNALENNGTGGKRLRKLVLDALGGRPSSDAPDRGEAARLVERARAAEEKLDRVYEMLAEMLRVLKGDPTTPGGGGTLPRKPARPRRTRLRDVASVSLRIFGTIPAGWPQNFDETRCDVRYERVARGRFPEGAFGLDVRGDSMNAASPEPILDGQTVILVSPGQRTPRHHDIVAALCDGQTTLKRLQCPPGQGCVLRAESSNPAFGREIVPRHELTIQGVVVGRL